MNQQLDIRKYLDIFLKFKWFGIVPACVIVVALSLGSSFLPKIYESRCIVEVGRGNIENPLRVQRERPPVLGEQLNIFSENALKWDILGRVADTVGYGPIIENDDTYGILKILRKLGLKKDEIDESAQKEAVIGQLRKGIKFRLRQPSFLIVSYQGTRPEVNAAILNTLASKLIEERTKYELNSVGQNYEFVKFEMESYRKKLEEAEGQLKEFKQQHISELPSNMNASLSQLAEDKSSLLACELEMKEMTTRLGYLDKQIAQQEELVVSEVRHETNPMLVVLNQRIVDMEIELTRLRTNYTELHPRVTELKSQLEDLKQQRGQLQEETVDSQTSMLNPIFQQLVQDRQNTLVRIEVLKNRMVNLNKRINEYEENVKGMPEQEQMLLTLTRNYEVTANIYNMFLQKVEEVRLQEKLASEEMGRETFRMHEYARAGKIGRASCRERV